MIKSIKHKGLEKFYESGSTKGVQANHAKKLRMQLAALDTAQSIDDMDIPGYRLHQLTGDREGIWTISVNANWRLTFEFEEGNVYILNYEDYH
jgi:proteic killer suppression protein